MLSTQLTLLYCIIQCGYMFQLFSHPQTTCAHKTKITIVNFILVQNEISGCYTNT